MGDVTIISVIFFNFLKVGNFCLFIFPIWHLSMMQTKYQTLKCDTRLHFAHFPICKRGMHIRICVKDKKFLMFQSFKVLCPNTEQRFDFCHSFESSYHSFPLKINFGAQACHHFLSSAWLLLMHIKIHILNPDFSLFWHHSETTYTQKEIFGSWSLVILEVPFVILRVRLLSLTFYMRMPKSS